MLGFVSGVFLRGRIRCKNFRRSLELADIRDIMRNHWLRWFGHVMRRCEKGLVWAILGLRVESERDRDRPKLTRKQVVRTDMAAHGIDGIEWILFITVTRSAVQ